VQGRDALGIIILSLIIILIRSIFSASVIVLPALDELSSPSSSSSPLFQPSSRSSTSPTPSERPAHNATTVGELYPFDPNTLDSTGFRKLGFSASQTHSLLKYRSSGARFRKPEDFSRSYVVSEQMYQRLKPFIRIAEEAPLPEPSIKEEQHQEPNELPTILIDINRADTSQLQKLRGIGPYYAKKIVQYRELLGGFVMAEQLLEIEGIDDDRLSQFRAQIEIVSHWIRKIDLQNADQSTLGKHPYIGQYAARWIVHYRELLGDTICTLPSLIRRNILKPPQAKLLEYYVAD
jgi:competence ComEA-like helix-hairpin-helix protein